MGVVLSVAIATRHLDLQMLLYEALLWAKNLGVTGILVFVLVYNLATVLFVPAALLTLSGGALYGVWWGSVYVFVAATLGATVAFLIGRYFARPWVNQRLQGHPTFQAIDHAVTQNGLKIVLLTRLSPMIPFNVLNYIFGITCVSLKDYMIGSVGMVPGTVLYVYIGALAGNLAMLGMPQEQSSQVHLMQWLVKGLGFLATVIMTVYITRIARRSLDQCVASQEADL
jgi:uncharacterized membrane protein YdjX (TVP38/TMEM64 family)